MATVSARPAPPPGAGRALADYTATERRAAAAWIAEHAGGAGHEVFVPGAVRALDDAFLVHLALSEKATAAWEERELRRVKRSPVYFTQAYGHLQPPKGSPIPFEFWPLVERAAELAVGCRTQEELLRALWREHAVLVLKARQLGITWLVLHYAYWLLAFNPDTPRARVLALSKHGIDARKLLARARRIRALLPAFLRHDESSETRGSTRELALVGRGTIVSLAGDPEAARSETATYVIVDEGAFVRNQGLADTLTAIEATTGDDGQQVVLSTGNGQSGDGAAFSDEVMKCIDGRSDRFFVFLPDQTDPRRGDEWRERARRKYPTDEKFRQEHPENIDDGLGGDHSIKVYPTAHIRAAVAIGKALGALDVGLWVDALVKREGLEWGVDWGDFQTFAIWGVGLPSGGPRGLSGLMLTDERVMTLLDPEDASLKIIGHQHRYLSHEPRFIASRGDASPPGNNKILAKRLARKRELDPGRWPEQHVSVPFGVYKEGGVGKQGVNTVAYVQALLQASFDFVNGVPEGEVARAEAVEVARRRGWSRPAAELAGDAAFSAAATAAATAWDDPDRLRGVRGVLAVSPRCKLWIAQARNLEKDRTTGKVVKPDADPHRPEHGDHGPDAVVALAYRRAEIWTMLADEEMRTDETEDRADRHEGGARRPSDW